MRSLVLLAGMMIFAALPQPSQAQQAAGKPAVDRCSFQSLSAADKDRYQSRYNRRVRVDGQAYADRWLREEVCPSPSQATERNGTNSGKNCRAVSRPVTSMDGSMTIGIGYECD